MGYLQNMNLPRKLGVVWYMYLNICFQFQTTLYAFSHTFLPTHISKNTNNVIRITLPNGPLIFKFQQTIDFSYPISTPTSPTWFHSLPLHLPPFYIFFFTHLLELLLLPHVYIWETKTHLIFFLLLFSLRLDTNENENYFTIQLIFGTIHRPHYTISANYYLYLQYFQQ